MHFSTCRRYLQAAIQEETLASLFQQHGLPLCHIFMLRLEQIKERFSFRYGFTPVEIADFNQLTPEVRELLIDNNICAPRPHTTFASINTPRSLSSVRSARVLTSPSHADHLELQCLLNDIPFSRHDHLSIVLDKTISIIIHIHQYLAFGDKASLMALVALVDDRFSRHKHRMAYFSIIEEGDLSRKDELPQELQFIIEAKRSYRQTVSLETVILFLSHFTNVIGPNHFSRVETLLQLSKDVSPTSFFHPAVQHIDIYSTLTHRTLDKSNVYVTDEVDLGDLDISVKSVKRIKLN